MNRSPEVDAYIAAAPKAAQPHLRALRKLIREAAPQAEERISYGIPFYDYQGRLIYFAAHKSHVALYPSGDARGLEDYLAAKATLRFPLDRPLPLDRIKKLIEGRVKTRVAENEAKAGTAASARPYSSRRSAARGGASASRRASRS